MTKVGILGELHLKKEIVSNGDGRFYLNRAVNIQGDVPYLDQTETEYQALLALDHDKIPELIETKQGYKREFIEGESLHDALYKSDRQFSRSEVIKRGIELLEIITYAHDQGILHRDLKPHNIIIRENDDALCVTDFGVAKLRYFAGSATTNIVGTYPYMAPEQTGLDAYSASDIHAIGAILIEMLTGQTVDKYVVNGHSLDTKKVVLPDTIDIGLRMVLEKSVETYASRRYQDCKQFSRALKSVLDGNVPDIVIGKPVKRRIGDVQGVLDEALRLWDQDSKVIVQPVRFMKTIDDLLHQTGFDKAREGGNNSEFFVRETGGKFSVFAKTDGRIYCLDLKSPGFLGKIVNKWALYLEGEIPFRRNNGTDNFYTSTEGHFGFGHFLDFWEKSPHLPEVAERIKSVKNDSSGLYVLDDVLSLVSLLQITKIFTNPMQVSIEKKIQKLLEDSFTEEEVEEWKPYHGEIRGGRDAIMALIE